MLPFATSAARDSMNTRRRQRAALTPSEKARAPCSCVIQANPQHWPAFVIRKRARARHEAALTMASQWCWSCARLRAREQRTQRLLQDSREVLSKCMSMASSVHVARIWLLTIARFDERDVCSVPFVNDCDW